ncbi:MAG: GGDEF domain-containing protein [bacterium]|nr:GGDEF domain-containing protein [bacterium]
MLSDLELQQICRVYKIVCPVCLTAADFHRLKRDMARAVKTAGDGYPLTYKWQKPGFDSVDPKQFFMGVCSNCGFAGELEDADFRQAGNAPDAYRKDFEEASLNQFKDSAAAGKGAAQSLLKRVSEGDELLNAIAQVHLGIISQCARRKVLPGPIARLYLRIAWLFRDRERFYAGSDLEEIGSSLKKCRSRWDKELPNHDDYPVRPMVVVDEIEALRMARAYFERNYETLKEAKVEDELRLRYLLAEIGFRLYELSNDAADHKKAASFFSGTMQKCLSIISDKTIVGGMVNRAREMLEIVGERGRELRAMHKERGGSDAEESDAVAAQPATPKKTASPAKEAKSAKETSRTSGKSSKPEDKQPSKAEAAASTGDTEALAGPERDRMTREIVVLTQEVGKLTERVVELEADNKKWRQLIGRDALTGLPNKISLFRIHLPKVIREFASSGPFSCIAISLDQLVKVNEDFGWPMGDKMLQASARGLRKFVQDGDDLSRLDGANFVIAGPMDQNVARQRATEMRRALGGSSVRVDETAMPLASSLGVVSVEQTTTRGSDAESANAIYAALLAALYQAKRKGGNTVETHSVTRF